MQALILTVMAATLLIAHASPQDRVKLSRKEQIEESAKKVKELQKERIVTLKEMADLISRLSSRSVNGRASNEEVLEARLLVLKAELDAAEKESDRITIYKNIVDELKKYEKFADAQVKFARGTVATTLKFKARRLEAEIDLERAKAKEAKETK